MDRIRGVALVVVSPEGKILILKELQEKPELDKKSGMFSIPMETCEIGEHNEEAIIRLVMEELPGLFVSVDSLAHIGSYQIVPEVWVQLFSMKVANTKLPNLDPANKEVSDHQWCNPREALKLWLRRGAKEMISDFINKKLGITRQECEPSNGQEQ